VVKVEHQRGGVWRDDQGREPGTRQLGQVICLNLGQDGARQPAQLAVE